MQDGLIAAFYDFVCLVFCKLLRLTENYQPSLNFVPKVEVRETVLGRVDVRELWTRVELQRFHLPPFLFTADLVCGRK